MGCTSVDVKDRTSYATDADSLAMKKIAMENAAHRYLLLDVSKLERRSFLRFASTNDFDLVICDQDGTVDAKAFPENFRFI